MAKLKFLIFWFHNIKIWFKWNKIRPRLWCCKIKNFNFLPDFRKFYLLFETPSSSKYITGIPCNHHTSDVWYVKRLYSNFLLKTSNFRDLRRCFSKPCIIWQNLRSWVCTGPFFWSFLDDQKIVKISFNANSF